MEGGIEKSLKGVSISKKFLKGLTQFLMKYQWILSILHLHNFTPLCLHLVPFTTSWGLQLPDVHGRCSESGMWLLSFKMYASNIDEVGNFR